MSGNNNALFKTYAIRYLQSIAELEQVKKHEAEIVERLKTLYEVIKKGMVERKWGRMLQGNVEIRCVLKETSAARKKEERKAELLALCAGNEANARRIWEACNAKVTKQDYYVEVGPANPLEGQISLDQIQ